MRGKVIEVDSLTKEFGAFRALDRVSFSVAEGEVFGYLGPNGCGKTTTVRVLATLIPPTSGDVRIFGLDPRTNDVEIRKRIGLVQQQISYEPYLSVWENVWLYGYLWGLSKADSRKAGRELLEAFGLGDVKLRKAVALSGGQRRRLQIVRELLLNPQLLFLDEPTVGLDVESRLTTLDFFRSLARKGTTIFFTTHNLSEVDELCNRVAFLNKGRLLATESVESFRSRAAGRRLEDAYLEIVKEKSHAKSAT